MQCEQMQTTLGCRASAGGAPLGTVITHTEYRTNDDGEVYVYKTRYTDGANVPIALGAGETVTPGACSAGGSTFTRDAIHWCVEAPVDVFTCYEAELVREWNGATLVTSKFTDYLGVELITPPPAGWKFGGCGC